MASMRNGVSRGENSAAVIEAAKARAKKALRQKNPKLTVLEQAFYTRFKQLRAAEAKSLIQIKPARRSRPRAA